MQVHLAVYLYLLKRGGKTYLKYSSPDRSGLFFHDRIPNGTDLLRDPVHHSAHNDLDGFKNRLKQIAESRDQRF